MYAHARGAFRTPKGRPVTMVFRLDSSDWNTINAVMGANDEYQLARLDLDGVAVDIGSHVGAVAIALLLDNPALRAVAVEPVPGNADLIDTNAELNGVSDRLTVVRGAAGPAGLTTSEIRFGFVGDPNLEHHAFIGNSSLAYDTGGDTPHESLTVQTYGLAALLDLHDIDTADFLKIDCEGGEWPFFDAPEDDLRRLPFIVGEAHPVRGHSAKDIRDLLGATHTVTLNGPNQDPGPCGFEAVRNA